MINDAEIADHLNLNMGFKRGWTNDWYCCESCELSDVSRVHASMPNSGPLPRANWVPQYISRDINERWED